MKKIITLCFFLISFSVHGQHYNALEPFLKANSVWTFGSSAGLDFNNGQAGSIETAYNEDLSFPGTSYAFNEGGASVADPITGELLFYYDGHVVRNKEHAIMPNGTGLLRDAENSTQGACIVPMIDSPGKYYLFSLYGSTAYSATNPPANGSLFYSIVDMSLENGLGNIVTGQKNLVLDTDSLSESMIAIPGNNCDIWLMVHALDQPVFKAYHITQDGINPIPVTSTTGTQIQGSATGNGTFLAAYAAGSLAVSPDRSKIALSSGFPITFATLFLGYAPAGLNGVLLCDFDAETGIVSEAMLLGADLDPYSLAFSPDNSKLYMITGPDMSLQRHLYQFDISNNDSAAIANSKTGIATTGFGDPVEGYLKLYDNIIYVNEKVNATALSTINAPNLSGAACDYQAGSIPLSAGTLTKSGLPNDVVYPMPPDSVYATWDTLICTGWETGISLRPAIVSNDYVYEWSDGSTDTLMRVTEKGVYWVKYNDGCHVSVDTFILKGSDVAVTISIEDFELRTTLPYHSYQWLLNGTLIADATNRIYAITQNGAYQVVVTTEDGCIDTSEVYTIENYTRIDDLSNPGKNIRVYPNPAADVIRLHSPVKTNVYITTLAGRVLRQIHDIQEYDMREIYVGDLRPGMYLINITNKDGKRLKVEKLYKE